MVAGARRMIPMPWRGRNAALLARQIRTSSGMVWLPPPPPAPKQADLQVINLAAPVGAADAVYAELRRLAVRRAPLPAMRDLAMDVHLSRYTVVRALDVLIADRRIVMMQGALNNFPQARAIRLPPSPGAAGGAVLRNTACPIWWTP